VQVLLRRSVIAIYSYSFSLWMNSRFRYRLVWLIHTMICHAQSWNKLGYPLCFDQLDSVENTSAATHFLKVTYAATYFLNVGYSWEHLCYNLSLQTSLTRWTSLVWFAWYIDASAKTDHSPGLISPFLSDRFISKLVCMHSCTHTS
jgi:hypothetical protein